MFSGGGNGDGSGGGGMRKSHRREEVTRESERERGVNYRELGEERCSGGFWTREFNRTNAIGTTPFCEGVEWFGHAKVKGSKGREEEDNDDDGEEA